MEEEWEHTYQQLLKAIREQYLMYELEAMFLLVLEYLHMLLLWQWEMENFQRGQKSIVVEAGLGLDIGIIIMMETVKEDIYSMCDIAYIDYGSLVANYAKIIEYACKSSETFSLITQQKRPFSKRPPNCKHANYLKELEPFLVSQIVGATEWPGTITKDRHKILNTYKSCAESKHILLASKNPFEFCNEMPEDISFYRHEQPWLVTTSHEKIAYLDRPIYEDVAFFEDWLLK